VSHRMSPVRKCKRGFRKISYRIISLES